MEIFADIFEGACYNCPQETRNGALRAHCVFLFYISEGTNL